MCYHTSDLFCACLFFSCVLNHCHCANKEDHHHTHKDHHQEENVWLYASLAVLAISICGLLSVAIIPVIQKLCYHALVQFLISLAVGSLSGDALLHLLPHAMVMTESGHHTQQHNGKNVPPEHSKIFIWRGFTALLAVYLFFLTECLLNHLSSYQKMKRKTKSKILQMPKFARSLTNVDKEQSRAVGEKLSHHKHDSYGYKFDIEEERDVESFDIPGLSESNVFIDNKRSPTATDHLKSENELQIDIDETVEEDCIDCVSSIKSVKSDLKTNLQNKTSPLTPLCIDVPYDHTKKEEVDISLEDCHRETVVHRHTHDNHSYVVTVTDHSHQHGHSHELSSTVSSVACMVIMSDALHNFCDGLAIGAAFGSNISIGISSSIAVLFHELPHELGDFAMLLNAGMTVKQAMLFNSISSFLCFLGTLIGIALGNIPEVTNWIFAGAAGMFLYIAFVDMLPELSTKSGHFSCCHLMMQICGITIGISIMLLIAIYEHDLQHLVS